MAHRIDYAQRQSLTLTQAARGVDLTKTGTCGSPNGRQKRGVANSIPTGPPCASVPPAIRTKVPTSPVVYGLGLFRYAAQFLDVRFDSSARLQCGVIEVR